MNVSIAHGFVTIDHPPFMGPCTQSPSGRFTLGWRDPGPSGGKQGRYVLIEGLTPIVWGQLQRPNDGIVVESGHFALCDWLRASVLSGRFYVCDRTGEVLISHRVRANLLNCGLSDDGRWAACATAGANTSDGDRVFFFDVMNRKMTWKVEPPARPAGFIFDAVNCEMFLHIGNGEGFRYSFDGQFLDQDALKAYAIQKARAEKWGYSLMRIADDRLAELDGQQFDRPVFDEVVSLVVEAAAKEISPNVVANMHRALGEIADDRGWGDVAADHYRQAMELNPKIGVKRRLVAIEAKLSSGGSTLPSIT